MQHLVSIIIPVYNLEKYIQFNIDNILSQTYENLEIIYVDDGSTDSSAQIIKSAAEKDSRIKYYFKENGGVSSARNLGIEKANGKYIMYVDGDDLIHKNAVEILLNACSESNYDVVCSEMKKVTGDVPSEIFQVESIKAETKLTEWFFKINDDGCILGKSSCGKLFLKKAIDDLRFPESFTNSEDYYYNVKFFNRNLKIGYIDAVLYFYYMRSESLTHAKREKDVVASIKANDEICGIARQGNDEFLKQYSVKNLMSELLANRSYSVGMKNEKEIHKLIKDIYNKNKKYFYSSNIDIKLKVSYGIFFKSRFVYEKYRLMKDPTMKDFYNQRKQNNNQ